MGDETILFVVLWNGSLVRNDDGIWKDIDVAFVILLNIIDKVVGSEYTTILVRAVCLNDIEELKV